MRLDGLQAAFLSAKLPYLDGWTHDRAAVSAFYTPRIAAMGGIRIIENAPGAESAHHLFVVCHEDRERFKKLLEARGIGTGIHYPVGVHRQQAWIKSFPSMSLPVTEYIADHCLSLPIFGAMNLEEAELVVAAVAEALDQAS
jgi:dTDP-4-amino-4,6-dideoxygalactose transaminase